MKKVQILMSTYNGEKYLKEQLDSILKQDYPDISLLIRDDGSTDNTINIIKEYASFDSRVTYYLGNNKGVINSFFDLIKNADTSMDYYCLSDQDDVWKVNKISRAVESLCKMNIQKPLLYCGRTILVDSNLQPITTTIKRHRIVPSFGNALVENINTGCTSAFNRELLLLVKEHIPDFTVMHDWWFYLSAIAFGEVFYDEESYILYRQHGNNIIGTKTNYYDEFKKRLMNYKGNLGNINRQAREFQRLYKVDFNKDNLLEYTINAKYKLRYRIRILWSNLIYRQRTVDNFIFKMMFLFGEI